LKIEFLLERIKNFVLGKKRLKDPISQFPKPVPDNPPEIDDLHPALAPGTGQGINAMEQRRAHDQAGMMQTISCSR